MYNLFVNKSETDLTDMPFKSATVLFDMKGTIYKIGVLQIKSQFFLCSGTACFELRKDKQLAKKSLKPKMAITIDAGVDVTLSHFTTDTKIVIAREAE